MVPRNCYSFDSSWPQDHHNLVQRKKSQESDSSSEFPKKGNQAKGGHTKSPTSRVALVLVGNV